MILRAALLTVSLVVPTHDNWISATGQRNAAGEWCCGQADCLAIPATDVVERAAGFYVRLPFTPGEYLSTPFAKVLVPRPYIMTITRKDTLTSLDGQFWYCRKPDGTRRCFFAPKPSS